MPITVTSNHAVTALAQACPHTTDVSEMDPFELAALLAPLSPTDIAALPAGLAEVVIAATQRVVNAAIARQAAAIEAFHAAVVSELAATEVPAGVDPDRVGASMLAPILRVAPRTMLTRQRRACRLVDDLPRTFAAAWAGDLEPSRVDAITAASNPVRSSLLVEYEARVHDDPTLSTMPTGLLRRRAAKAALRTDPDGVQAGYRDAVGRRGVTVVPGDAPGMTRWTADLPADTSQRMWAAVDSLATELLTADKAAEAPGARTVDNARADALAALVMSNAHVETRIELILPITRQEPSAAAAQPNPNLDLALDDDGLAALVRGEVTEDTLAASVLEWELAGLLQRPYEILINPNLHRASDGTAWFVAAPITDPRIGVLLPDMIAALLADPDVRVRVSDTSSPPPATPGYRPGAALARAVRARDQHCRFPGCTVPANQCDLDHAIPHPEGPTSVGNLHALCRFHHLFKHHAGWHVRLDPDGSCHWTAPTGRTHTTRPPNPHDQAA